MSASARLFRGSLLIAAFVIAGGVQAALAQELQFDPRALDPSTAGAAQPKGKKAKAQQMPRSGAAAGQQQGSGPNRQFGELEGWSPGKAPPPKPGEKEAPSGPAKGSMPVGMSPSGNMSVGLPF